MISLSDIDEKRFGIPSARADDVEVGDLDGIDSFCREKGVRFLIARCGIDRLDVAQAMEERDFRLMDTLIYCKFDFAKKTPLPPLKQDIYIIRDIKAGEEHALRDMATEIFHDYQSGHYHADPLLDRAKCNEVYPDWAYNSCLFKQAADKVLVAESQKQLVGFITVKNKGEIVLNGVLPAFQKKGIYADLLTHALHALQPLAKHVVVSTQLSNFAPQKIWARLGFEPHEAMYTFHKWYEPA